MLTTVKDLTGQVFGKLTVLERAPRPGSKRAFWLCRCVCGQQTVKMGKYLLSGDTSSCGCEQKAMRARGNAKYGAIQAKDHPREYSIWRSMKSRCYVRSSSNYKFYGALGVTICDRWRGDFSAFLSDMGVCPPEHTIDRIENDKGYEPGNCRWATWEMQLNNTSRNVVVQFDGTRTTLALAARAAGVDYQRLYTRMTNHKEPIEVAVAHLRQHP